MNLTLLLKALGFRLENFDFDGDNQALKNETVTIEIKCNKSGIKSSLTYNLVNCTCPEKSQGNNASFWEVQATGPKVMSRFKTATFKDGTSIFLNVKTIILFIFTIIASSNLLPEISDNCSQVAKAMLSNLLDFYQENIKETAVEREKYKSSPLKPYSPSIFVTSPGLTLRSPYSTPPAEGKYVSRFSFPSIPADKVKCEVEIKREDPQVPVIKIENDHVQMKEEKNEDTVIIDGPDLLAQVPSSTFDINDTQFSNSDAMKNFITSSPNEKTFDAMVQANDRDVHVIQSLTNARQQIDNALLFMKINGTISLPNNATSIITTTPQNIVKDKTGAIPKMPERANTMTNLQPARPSPLVTLGKI